MQYALIEFKDRWFVIDAHELQALHQHTLSITERPKPDERGPFFIAYRLYKPQPGIDKEQARADVLQAQDMWLGHVEDDACHAIAYHAIEALPPVQQGMSFGIPFAALIQADPALIDRIADPDSSQAVTAFLRYANISPADNLLTRPGVFAFKGIERRTKALINLDTWRDHIDKARADRTAWQIG
ncbi:hypothetical protein SAMN05216466_106136 [Paraburkholderia phenazinium]|uniref:Uncharacterized protein n=1 Tax=Paraburkholderia phenazinium TaxID=60549 RepID=A0A1G7YD68_9BURK|nr:hypothetical protein [Paraburkholderia phenazinium]SDG94334.1 hypothetical protein SAMN05216466_106136 [Paraburkholderia phenazinium]